MWIHVLIEPQLICTNWRNDLLTCNMKLNQMEIVPTGGGGRYPHTWHLASKLALLANKTPQHHVHPGRFSGLPNAWKDVVSRLMGLQCDDNCPFVFITDGLGPCQYHIRLHTCPSQFPTLGVLLKTRFALKETLDLRESFSKSNSWSISQGQVPCEEVSKTQNRFGHGCLLQSLSSCCRWMSLCVD